MSVASTHSPEFLDSRAGHGVGKGVRLDGRNDSETGKPNYTDLPIPAPHSEGSRLAAHSYPSVTKRTGQNVALRCLLALLIV